MIELLVALRHSQRLLHGDHVDDIFKKDSLTSWDMRLKQTIGFTLLIDDETYQYELAIDYAPQEDKRRICREELIWQSSTFFLFDGQDAHLYRINRNTKQAEEGSSFPAGWSRSVIPTIAQRDDNRPLVRFREEVGKLLLINPVPLVVKDAAESESRILSEHTENFAQWYRHILQEFPRVSYRAIKQLADVLPGFEQLSLKETGDSRRLTATFRINDKDHDFDFMDLSDGQRQLIVLYTVLEALRDGIFSTILIDEPDNFLSLREIQPWFDNLSDICDEKNKQAIMISHHPEIVNRMVQGKEIWFSRKNGAHIVTQPYPVTPGLTPAETLARGWEDA